MNADAADFLGTKSKKTSDLRRQTLDLKMLISHLLFKFKHIYSVINRCSSTKLLRKSKVLPIIFKHKFQPTTFCFL